MKDNSSLINRLQAAVEDPRWDGHAEISKETLREAIAAMREMALSKREWEAEYREHHLDALDKALEDGLETGLMLGKQRNSRFNAGEAEERLMKQILVFATAINGHHIKGSAQHAMSKYGAVFGCGEGLAGQSYAIPVYDEKMRPRPLVDITESIGTFLRFAAARPGSSFRITPIGCEDGSFLPEQIAPLFKDAPANCDIPYTFLAALQGHDPVDPMAQTNRHLRNITDMVRELISEAGVASAGLDDESEALCLMMMCCMDLLRQKEGGDFVASWMLRALRDIHAGAPVIINPAELQQA